MEIRIGVQHAPREITVETEVAVEDVTRRISEALEHSTPLTLTDSKGRTVIVPGEKIAFVEVSSEQPRRVGFLG